MNNSQYKVKVHTLTLPGTDGSRERPALRFEHPVTEGPGGHGGWMAAEAAEVAGEGPQAIVCVHVVRGCQSLTAVRERQDIDVVCLLQVGPLLSQLLSWRRRTNRARTGTSCASSA